MKKIALYGGWSRNYGDLAINVAMKQMFQANSPEPLEFIDVNSDVFYDPEGFRNYPAPRLSNDLIEEINDTCDLFIVGGGGQLMHRNKKDSVSGWQFNCTLGALDKLKTPLVVFGIGYNKFPNELPFIYDFKKHLNATYDKTKLFSVRNKGTADTVYECIGDGKPIYLISDPAMFIKSKPIHIPNLENIPVLGINWAGDVPNKRFTDTQETDLFLDMLRVCRRWIKDTGGKILYIPHLMIYDFDTFKYFKDQLGDDVVGLHENCPWLYPESLLATPLFVGAYKACTAVIGMRGHSNILPFGQGVPAFAIGTQPKLEFFQKDIGGQSFGMEPYSYYDKFYDIVFTNNVQTRHNMQMKYTECFNDTNTFVKMCLGEME